MNTHKMRAIPIYTAKRLASVLAMAVLATSLIAVGSAQAHYTKYKHRHHNGTKAAIALGIAGLVIGGAVAHSRTRSHCHGRNYCHIHGHNRSHFHTRSGAIRYGSPKRTVRKVVRISNAHARYCFGKYKSYRVSDNTYQPFKGPRRACRSPF